MYSDHTVVAIQLKSKNAKLESTPLELISTIFFTNGSKFAAIAY